MCLVHLVVQYHQVVLLTQAAQDLLCHQVVLVGLVHLLDLSPQQVLSLQVSLVDLDLQQFQSLLVTQVILLALVHLVGLMVPDCLDLQVVHLVQVNLSHLEILVGLEFRVHLADL